MKADNRLRSNMSIERRNHHDTVDGRCSLCLVNLKEVPWELAHVLPESLGGSRHYWNLLPLCRNCHYPQRELLGHTWFRQKGQATVDRALEHWTTTPRIDIRVKLCLYELFEQCRFGAEPPALVYRVAGKSHARYDDATRELISSRALRLLHDLRFHLFDRSRRRLEWIVRRVGPYREYRRRIRVENALLALDRGNVELGLTLSHGLSPLSDHESNSFAWRAALVGMNSRRWHHLGPARRAIDFISKETSSTVLSHLSGATEDERLQWTLAALMIGMRENCKRSFAFEVLEGLSAGDPTIARGRSYHQILASLVLACESLVDRPRFLRDAREQSTHVGAHGGPRRRFYVPALALPTKAKSLFGNPHAKTLELTRPFLELAPNSPLWCHSNDESPIVSILDDACSQVLMRTG